MAAAASRPKFIAIVGPTASGKSQLALRLAQGFNGEIIAADSRTIYKGMDIGTAKPTAEEQAQVSHWGLNLIEPGEPYSAYKFKNYAEDVMADIKNRGKLSILVGGTGLYIDSLIFDFGFAGPANPIERYRLEGLPSQKLRAIIKQKDYPMPKNSQNRRHLIRVIERRGQVVSNKKLRNDVALVGIRFSEEELKQRISLRAARIFNEGVVEETRELIRHHGKHAIWTTGGIVYKICMRLLEGELTEEQALESFVKADWQYAKRQKTWFGRNKFIQWFKTPEEAFTSVKQVLNK